MRFNSLEISNFGPVKSGTIGGEKIIVFFGPNNSGKSMVSKLVHSASLFRITQRKVVDLTLLKYMGVSPEEMPAWHMLYHSGLTPSRAVTYGKKKCSITMKSRGKTISIRLPPEGDISSAFYAYKNSRTFMPTGKSIYIPASRTGTIEAFHNITQMRTNLLYSVLSALKIGAKSRKPMEVREFLESTGTLPVVMDEFYDIFLDALTNGVTQDILDTFQMLFGGQIKPGSRIMQTLIFQDSYGASVHLQDAGSGVISALPILLGLHRVRSGGRLIVEEPEAHLEPKRQFKLMDLLWATSKARKINLALTTHSESVVNKILSMVSRQILKPAELGLYYFDRDEKGLTVIRKIHVDRDGTAEQPIFEKAMDALIEEFSK